MRGVSKKYQIGPKKNIKVCFSMTVTIFKVLLVCKIKTKVLAFLSKIAPNVFYKYNVECLS